MGAMDFTADLDDIRFCLYEQYDIDGGLSKIEKYADFDKDTYEAMLDEAYRVAREVLDPINGPGDREGCSLDVETGTVTTPKGYKEAWAETSEGGWFAMTAPPEVGGTGLPATIYMACTEMFVGAAMAFWMYPGLTAAAARVLLRYGPEGMAGEYAERMFSGEWGGTMCLTEAGAGSSVGDNRCKARPVGDGVYELEGEKIFISGGDQDLTSNIMHLVLARTPDSPPGTKGLSLFLVPKFLVNDDGSVGERNGAYVVGIEEKMGIHGSATCTLSLGDRHPCKGWLVGNEHEGIAVMFTMMNEARIGVGAQGLAVGAAAYQYALAYAKERVQGTSISNFRDAGAERVTIVQHADVRRMLMTMKVQVETMRSLLYRLGHQHDLAENTADEATAERYMNRVELLTPILKSVNTDIGHEVAVTAIQVMGGYGFIGEYPVEQLARDGKIMSIYEGTNGIQAMDLLGRKMRMKGGKLFMEWMQDGLTLCNKASELGFEDQAAALTKAVNACGATAMHLGGLGAQGKLEGAMLQSVPFQTMMGTVVLGLEALDQALVAKRLIDAGDTRPHVQHKALNLKFYTANLLPKAIALGRGIQAGDESCLDPGLFA